MRGTSCTNTAVLIGFLLASAGCSKDPPTSPRACFEALEKGQQMLTVPDHEAAKSWLGRAKKDCLSDQQAALAQLEKDIPASEARVAEMAKKKEESFKAKPADQSLVPKFVAAVVKYRDQKKREKCENDPCGEVETVSGVSSMTIRRSTAKGSRDAFRVFTRITSERVACEQLGAHTVKRRWEVETQVKFLCEITGGDLSGLSVLLEQEKERPETYIVAFTEKWLERDEQLKTAITQ